MKYKVTGKATWLYWRNISVKDLIILEFGINIFETKDKAIATVNKLRNIIGGNGRIDDYEISEA